jgi:hypothetical protein
MEPLGKRKRGRPRREVGQEERKRMKRGCMAKKRCTPRREVDKEEID